MESSTDGKGRALDNIITERLWLTVKYEEVPARLQQSKSSPAGLTRYFGFYNHERRHQSIEHQTPSEVCFQTAA